jgi:phosphonate transport system substrate-binding protein
MTRNAALRTLLAAALLGLAPLSQAQQVLRVTAIPDESPTELARKAAPLMKYAERIFSRQGFIDALTPSEKVMRR